MKIWEYRENKHDHHVSYDWIRGDRHEVYDPKYLRDLDF